MDLGGKNKSTGTLYKLLKLRTNKLEIWTFLHLTHLSWSVGKQIKLHGIGLSNFVNECKQYGLHVPLTWFEVLKPCKYMVVVEIPNVPFTCFIDYPSHRGK